MKRFLTMLICLFAVCLCAFQVSAAETEAEDISEQTRYTSAVYGYTDFLKNKNVDYYVRSDGNAEITLENEQGMGSLYLLFDWEYGAYTVTDNTTGESFTAGEQEFLHEFLDLEAAFGTLPTSVTLHFDNGAVTLSEIYVFSAGEVPSFVQRWQAPLDGCADILLMPTHSDDDQLFFAGIIPYYAAEKDCAVQVAYLTDHQLYNSIRLHEMLNGLWATGIKNYPVFGFSLDFLRYDMEETYREYEYQGISRESLQGYVVELMRRFKPQVLVAHDVNGEYMHGMHMVYTDLVRKGLELSNDPEQFPESAQAYGVWDVPKTYIHLWQENPVVIDIDAPLESFDGLSAFQVSQKYGFPCHVSQHKYLNFVHWLYGWDGSITHSSQIQEYNPAFYGLYRSTVGPDVNKNDFMENVITYAEQARLEQERLEQERLEQERLEQERLEQERLEQERLEQERLEQERLEQERLEQLATTRTTMSQEEFEKVWAEAKENSKIDGRMFIGLILAVFVLVFSFRFAMRMAKKNFGSNGITERIEQQKKKKK